MAGVVRCHGVLAGTTADAQPYRSFPSRSWHPTAASAGPAPARMAGQMAGSSNQIVSAYLTPDTSWFVRCGCVTSDGHATSCPTSNDSFVTP